MYCPWGVALDSSGRLAFDSILETINRLFHDSLFLSILGNIYIADSGNNRIRKATVSTGIISTVAGTDSDTYSGDNGAATSAGLSAYGVTLDSSGEHYSIQSCGYLRCT